MDAGSIFEAWDSGLPENQVNYNSLMRAVFHDRPGGYLMFVRSKDLENPFEDIINILQGSGQLLQSDDDKGYGYLGIWKSSSQLGLTCLVYTDFNVKRDELKFLPFACTLMELPPPPDEDFYYEPPQSPVDPQSLEKI